MADENFPRPALAALRNAGWVVFSVAEECPGISDEEVAAVCSESQQVLLTFDKDFGELVFHRGLSAGSGVVLFRFIPESPEEVAERRRGTASISARSPRDVLRYHTRANSSPAHAAPGLNGPQRAVRKTSPSSAPLITRNMNCSHRSYTIDECILGDFFAQQPRAQSAGG